MMTVGLEEVETYVLHHKNNASQYITTRPILELGLAAEQQSGAQVTRRWWEQDGINLGQEYRRAEEQTGEAEAEGEREGDTKMAAMERWGAEE